MTEPATQEHATWPVQDAKARFTQMLNACLSDGPQVVTRRGDAEAVIVSLDDWRRLTAARKPSLKELLLTDDQRFEIDLPQRGTGPYRTFGAL